MSEFNPGTSNSGALGTPLPVLVIEDEKFLLSYFQAALMRGGVKSAGATSGGEALELLQRGEFAAVVSDLLLPGGIDGAEVFDWVCQNRPELAQRFLFITGDLHSSYAAEVRERTGAMFLEKPFRVAQLLETLGKILSNSSKPATGLQGDSQGETVHV